MIVILNMDDETRKKIEELNPGLCYNGRYLMNAEGKTIGLQINVDWSWATTEKLRDFLKEVEKIEVNSKQECSPNMQTEIFSTHTENKIIRLKHELARLNNNQLHLTTNLGKINVEIKKLNERCKICSKCKVSDREIIRGMYDDLIGHRGLYGTYLIDYLVGLENKYMKMLIK